MDHLPMPKKLYLPIVSVVAALSYRKDNLDVDLSSLQHGWSASSQVLTDVAEILR